MVKLKRRKKSRFSSLTLSGKRNALKNSEDCSINGGTLERAALPEKY